MYWVSFDKIITLKIGSLRNSLNGFEDGKKFPDILKCSKKQILKFVKQRRFLTVFVGKEPCAAKAF